MTAMDQINQTMGRQDALLCELEQPRVYGMADIPAFDREGLIRALRIDQAGESTFPEFLATSWRAGVVRYDVDFEKRTVSYYGCNGEEYVEHIPQGTSASKLEDFVPILCKASTLVN